MSCTCFEGYTGNGIVRCDKITAPLMMSVLSLKLAETGLVSTLVQQTTLAVPQLNAQSTATGLFANVHLDSQETLTANVFLSNKVNVNMTETAQTTELA
jgi:hypothetical protein